MTKYEKLKADYDAAARECAGLVERVPVNEQLAIANKTKMDLSETAVKLRDALERKRAAASSLQLYVADVQKDAAAMLAQADQIVTACQAILRGEAIDLPAWPAPKPVAAPARVPAGAK